MNHSKERRTRDVRCHSLVLILFFLFFSTAIGPVRSLAQEVAGGRKQAHAVRVASGSIRLDGRIDDEAWLKAEPIVDFVQAEPNEGEPASDRMELRIVYDDTALWVAARMLSRPGSLVQAPMSRRDDGEQAEYLEVELDTYLDRRTAYMFGVTASGVRLDHFHPTDNESDADAEFDPVWEAKTVVNDEGWTAELWLPFSQLRFNSEGQRIWGLNVKRWRPQLNEQDYWVVIGRTERGWASRFGELRGVDDVAPKARFEVLPYGAYSSRMSGNRDLRNPFDSAMNPEGRFGMDMKVGLGSNLTLEATIHPDFGQIEADPAEVNLSVFETIFAEKRPFFIEGNNLLEAGSTNFYYSRRIGARPTGTASGDYVDYPDTTTILGAAKLTGRLKSGTSVGLLGAWTAREDALTSIGGLRSNVEVAPRTVWGVARVIQELDQAGSTIGAHLTLVHRDLASSDVLSSVLVRNAVTAGVDGRLRFDNRTYEASFNVGMTLVNGEPGAIEKIQRASTHYFQRLDQPLRRLDPSRTSFSGAQINGRFDKIAGRHWLWGSNLQVESPEFETTDFGRLNYAGDFMGATRLTYRETRPGRIFRAYSLAFSLNHYWFFDTNLGIRQWISDSNSFTLRNFWIAALNVTSYFRGQDVQLTRGGPAMGVPLGWSLAPSLRNSSGSKTGWSASGSLKTNEFGEKAWSYSGSVSARPVPSVQFSIAPTYQVEQGTNASFQGPINRQYLATLPGGRSETYGNRYVFGLVDRTTLSAQFRFNYTFKPDVNLDVYAEPFAASGQYRGIGELAAARARDLRMYGTEGTTIERLSNGGYRISDGPSTFTLPNRDFNARSYRSNVVLRWEWRPGSTLYVVWQQNRAADLTSGDHVGIGDLFGSFSAPGDNIFAIKSTVWISR